MKTRCLLLGLVCAALIEGGATQVEARSLADQVNSFFGPGGLALDVSHADPTIPQHAGHFSGSTLTTLGLLIQQMVPRASDFPAISTVPGLTFHYNSQAQLFERSSTSLGPVFVERAQTLGWGKFDLGFSYLFIDFDEFNGADLDHIAFTAQHSPDPIAGNDTATVRFERFTLQSHVLSFFATYGLTDQWDVNLLLPLVSTYWSMRSRARLDNENGPVHFFDSDPQLTERTFAAHDDKTGVGDLQLRTKYRLWNGERFNLASAFALRLPTGEEENFQGLGDTTLTSFLTLSYEYGLFHAHTSGGVEINFDDTDRSRVRYAGGVTLQVIEQLALSADVLGSANLATDRIAVNVPTFDNHVSATSSPLLSGFTHVTSTLRTDIVDLAVGMKANLFRSVSGFVTVFIPLNDEALRSDLIPAVGLEVSF
jgi:hypothetical protein